MLLEQHPDWAVNERRYLSEESMAKLYAKPGPETILEEPPLAITA